MLITGSAFLILPSRRGGPTCYIHTSGSLNLIHIYPGGPEKFWGSSQLQKLFAVNAALSAFTAQRGVLQIPVFYNYMKAGLLHIKLLILFCMLLNSAVAQRWGFGIYSGYASNSFDAFGHEHIRIAGSQYSGFDAEYQLDKIFGIRLSYTRQETKAAPPCFSTAMNTVIDRYEFGFTARKPIAGNKLDWTTGLGFGVCKLFEDFDYHDEVKLATSFNAGLNYHISRFIGIQLQGRLLQFYSKAISNCTTDNQVEPASYGTVVTQGSATAGLLFLIGK
jgi:hypothetical protein